MTRKMSAREISKALLKIANRDHNARAGKMAGDVRRFMEKRKNESYEWDVKGEWGVQHSSPYWIEGVPGLELYATVFTDDSGDDAELRP